MKNDISCDNSAKIYATVAFIESQTKKKNCAPIRCLQ